MTEKRMKFLNTKIDNIDMEEAILRVDNMTKASGYHYVVTPNVAHIVSLEKDDELKEIYDNADLVLTDGMPLIWISKLYGTPIKEKVSGSDVFPLICDMAAKRGYSIFILGAAEGVADNAAEKLKAKCPGLKIAGTYSPPYGFEKDEEKIRYTINKVNEAKADILFVSLGAPKQEKFIYKYRNELNVSVALGVGAAVDFEAGNIKRAPKWMQKSGLEGFYRFAKEPKRMFRRVFIDDFKIFPLIFKYWKK